MKRTVAIGMVVAICVLAGFTLYVRLSPQEDVVKGERDGEEQGKEDLVKRQGEGQPCSRLLLPGRLSKKS